MSKLILHAPFIIGARLLPALRVADACISLESVEPGARQNPIFVIDIGEASYRVDDIRSGMQGFRSLVEPFETLLSFMGACAESIAYRERTGRGGDNADLFEPALAQWCADNATAIESASCELQDENGAPRHSLIEVA